MGANKKQFTEDREREISQGLIFTPPEEDSYPRSNPEGTYRTTLSTIRKAFKELGLEARTRYFGARPGSEYLFEVKIPPHTWRNVPEDIKDRFEALVPGSRLRQEAYDRFSIWTREEVVK